MSNYRLDVGRGCNFYNEDNEDEAYAVESVGCHKLSSYDWMEDVSTHGDESDIFEIRFKNTRKGFYRNVNNLPLKRGDIVAVESSPGHDIGIVSLSGDMVRLQMKKSGFNATNQEFRKIYRKAKPYDIVKWQEAIALEHSTMILSRQLAADLGLNMKIGDVEYQGDRIKAIFYYIADERVDFRELIKILADRFKIRVEMKQIGARQEAGRIGGIASCGREMCCSTWVSSFVSVTTNSARFQEMSLNPQKLAGQCGKLKCCLNFEVDTYIDAKRKMPRINEPLETVDAKYFLVKTDILASKMSFSSDPSSMANVIVIDADRAREIIRLNKRGIKVESLRRDRSDSSSVAPKEPGFKNVVGEESITRFDNSSSQKKRRPNRNKSQSRTAPTEGQNSPNKKATGSEGGKPTQKQQQRPNQKQPQKQQPAQKAQEPKQDGEKVASATATDAKNDAPRKRRYNNRRPNSGSGKPKKSSN